MKKPINIILDLDNTLISAIDDEDARNMDIELLYRQQRAFEWMYMDNDFKIFFRPGLQEFLCWLFKHFNVSVWTAASQSYAIFIIDNIILTRPERKLDFILWSDHCKTSKSMYRHNKCIDMLSEIIPDEYRPDRTFIIDDLPEVYMSQPTKCIHIRPFDVTDPESVNDTELARVKGVLNRLRIALN